MKSLVSEPKAVICENPDSIFRYFGWPSVTKLPDGNLAMVASGFRMKHVCPFGKAIICYSRDEGKHWTAPAAVIDTPLDDRDAGITVFGKDRVILTSFNNTTATQRMYNNVDGHRWEDEKASAFSEAYLSLVDALQVQERYLGSTYRISEDGGYTFGPIRKSPVSAPHGPIRLLDGSLFYIGKMFRLHESEDAAGRKTIGCCRLNENDEFELLSYVDPIPEFEENIVFHEPHAVQLPDGKIIVHIRVEGSGKFTVYQSESTDGGLNFTKPHQILTDRGGSPAHLFYHSGGTLISAYGYREAPYGIRVALSDDGGEHWDTDYVLSDDGLSGDLGYPCTTELRDGRLLTVYYENIGGASVIMQKIWELPKK